jgi:hypothetical protein
MEIQIPKPETPRSKVVIPARPRACLRCRFDVQARFRRPARYAVKRRIKKRQLLDVTAILVADPV